MTPRTTKLARDAKIVFFPTYAFRDSRGCWRLEMCGAIYRPSVVRLRQRLLVKLLRRVMGVPPQALESDCFQERIRPFIAAPHRGRRLVVRLGDSTLEVRRRRGGPGYFRSPLRLLGDAATSEGAAEGASANRWGEFETLAPDHAHPVRGRYQILPDRGLSVVSDIDDTIKLSNVGSRRELLANTFLRPYEAVAGMSERYQGWAAEGAALHYVSSSPWQLFEPLEAFCREAGFPDGTFHLRAFRLGRHMLRRVLPRRRPGKAKSIRELLQRFPHRSFVLVGDSGEQDPELYAHLARAFPQQVVAIYIREVERRAMDGARRRLFAPDKLWVFRDASELPSSLAAGAC